MPKNYFDFKQFRIYQDQCAMKVCTDSCLFGAWINITSEKSILDIGTGTSLLSLMLAQKSNAKITAIEIEKNAFMQASQNINQSKFCNNINIIHTSLQEYIIQHGNQKFDAIVCNPPFFSSHLKSNENAMNFAKHDLSLNLQILSDSIPLLLNPEGIFHVMLPYFEASILEKKLKNYVKINHTQVYNLENDTQVFRVFNSYSLAIKNKKNNFLKNKIFIKNLNNEYTEDFKMLMQQYYTIF